MNEHQGSGDLLSEPAAQLLSQPSSARHRPRFRARIGEAHLLSHRGFGSVDGDLGTHYAKKEGYGT